MTHPEFPGKELELEATSAPSLAICLWSTLSKAAQDISVVPVKPLKKV